MNNILLTGGAGFIGSNLALKLINKGYKVRVLDNLSKQIHGENPENSPLYQSVKDKVEFVLGNVTNKKDWIKALKGQDAVIHLAAETGTGQSMYEVEKYINVNIKGTAILLDLLANEKHQVKKVLVASSRSIYGEGKYNCIEHGAVYPLERSEELLSRGDFELRCPKCNGSLKLRATDEDSIIHPSSIYGITKQSQEQMVLVACKAIGIPAVAFRYQNVYGPGQSLSNPYTGILSIFSTRILNDNPINIFEDGKESRDFVYIDDVVDATILGLENEKIVDEVFNVGSGENTTVMKVATGLKDLYNSSVSINVSGNYRLGDIRHNYADLKKIKAFGFHPKVMFDEGIALFAKWVKNQEIQKDNYDQSIHEMKQKGLFK
jgi:dTDP-L-rhamnose 4-epimerase